MKHIKTFFNTTLIIFLLSSCSYNSFEEKIKDEMDCSQITYSTSISSIIETNCSIPGCHSGSQSPDFRDFTNIQLNASRIKIRTQNRTMPKVGSLTQQEIDMIACWVDNGALNN